MCWSVGKYVRIENYLKVVTVIQEKNLRDVILNGMAKRELKEADLIVNLVVDIPWLIRKERRNDVL